MLAVYCDLHLWPADLKVNSDVLLIVVATGLVWSSAKTTENIEFTTKLKFWKLVRI